MLQQIIALLVILFFLLRLFGQKTKQEISGNEFLLWLIFWLIAAAAIIFLKPLDRLVKSVGFSGSGINLLVYLAVLALIYFVFRLSLEVNKLDRGLSALNEAITLKKAKTEASDEAAPKTLK